MYKLQVGFAREDITPEEYITLAGYGNDSYRMCNNILDRVMGTCVALRDERGEIVLLCTTDLLNAVKPTVVDGARRAIREATGVPEDHISVSVTHTHAGPSMYAFEDDIYQRFQAHYRKQMAKAAKQAIEDLQDAEVYIGQKLVPNMTFVRHYIANDGTYYGPNFGSGKSGPKCHADVSDDQLQVMRFVRKDARDVVLVNWQSHATITGAAKDAKGRSTTGTNMSADWPGVMRNHVEGSMGCHCAYCQGACGNLVPGSNIADEMIVERGNHLAYGTKMADFVIECLGENMRNVNAGPIQVSQYGYVAQVDHSDDHRVADAEAARKGYYDIEDPAERKAQLQKYGFNSVLHANSVVNRSKLDATQTLELMDISAGDISFATAPIEMFNSNGRFVKDNTPFEMTFMLAYTNGSNSYIPDSKAFEYDCYEKNTCRFIKGTGESIASTHIALLNLLKQK